jgi:tetratricopeptide (TPR) repeat protein
MIGRYHTKSLVERKENLVGSVPYNPDLYGKLPPPYSKLPMTYNNLGLTFQYLGRHDRALNYYNRAIKLHPNDLLPWINKGNLLAELGRYDEAQECYDKAFEIEPNDASVWHNKGVLLALLKRYDDARKCFEQALKIIPYYASAWNNKGDILNHMGHYKEAKKCFERALKVGPASERLESELGYGDTSNVSNKSIAWNGIGYALIYLNEPQEAMKCFQRALEIDPRNALAWYNKALYLVNKRDYRSAVQAYRKSLKLEPKNPGVWYSMGSALERLGKYQDALVCNRRAREINPREVNAWFNEGNLYYRLGKYRLAKESFEKVLELDKADAQAWYLIARCKNEMRYPLEEVISDLTKAIENGGEQYRMMASEDAPFGNIRGKDLFRVLTGSFEQLSNVDSDQEIRAKAKRHILREICKKYKDTGDPTCALDEVKSRLQGYSPSYIDITVNDLLSSSYLLESAGNIILTLTEQGKKSCRKGELLD